MSYSRNSYLSRPGKTACRGGRPRRRSGRRGSILFVAIGAVMVLSILALGTTSSVMQELRLARVVSRTDQAYYAVMAARAIAQIVLLRDDTPGQIVLYDLRDREVDFGGRRLRMRFSDEAALLPLHLASGEELVRLPGLDDGSIAGNLAQAEIFVKEDAMQVSGVTPELYALFGPYVTTFSTGPVNINTAQPPVLTALGMKKELIEDIQELRAGPDGQEGTHDDYWFLVPGSIAGELRDHAGISESQATLIANLVAQNKLSVSSAYVRIEAALMTGSREEEGAAIIMYLPNWKTVAWLEE